METAGRSPRVLVDHLGYDTHAAKSAIVVLPEAHEVTALHLETEAGEIVFRPLTLSSPVHAEGWITAALQRIDLSALTEPGRYRLVAEFGATRVASEVFVVADHRIPSLVVSDVTAYFRSQRSSGEIDRADSAARFYGDDSGRSVDARGGWLDASGDYSKFLSHLTYTRAMSPQQIPLCAWALLTAGDELRRAHPGFETSQYPRLRDEGLFGADFLVRFQAPEGYFYTGIFDALTKDLAERVINAPLQNSVRTQRWQAAYRHGGGLAIAALALASTADAHGEFDAQTYLAAAIRGFDHLEEHNTEYLFDGTETVLDDYCAVLAAAELARAVHVAGGDVTPFVNAARRRAASVESRLRRDASGAAYLAADAEGRPFFHAAEAGLPVVALLRWAAVVRECGFETVRTGGSGSAHAAGSVAVALMEGVIARTDAVANPFGYPRSRVQPEDGVASDSFFFPHDNETGYWWQGENAGISSLAYAAARTALINECPDDLTGRLGRLTADITAWVGGLNPFDACMLQGRGRNNVEYSGVYQNSPGGIVNGITSGWSDESGIAFLPDDAPDGEEWRWAEQWIPHSAWFLLAVCAS